MKKRALVAVIIAAIAMMIGAQSTVVGQAAPGEVDIDLDLDHDDLEDLDDNNILTICQDGYRNKVDLVHQFNGGNLLVIDQPGHGNDVCFVWQDNSASLTGYNIATICQSGHGNGVGAVIQVR